MEFVPPLLIIISAAFIVGAIAHRLRQPVILGFIVAGIALGPYTGGVTVTEMIDARLLSEIGVGLLLFALGLEFSLTTLRPASPLALFGTPIQLILTFLVGFVIGLLLGWQTTTAFWFAAFIVLSSPLVTLHTFESFNLGEAFSTRLSRSILIVQNLIVVTLIFVMRQLQMGNADLPTLVLAAVEGIGLLILLLAVGIFVLPRLYAIIARQSGNELSLVVVIAVVAVIIYGVFLYGLTFVEVAFVLGLIMSESDIGSRALKTLTSMRALFGVLFFVSAGMVLDLPFLGINIILVILLVMAVVLTKLLIIGGTTRLFGYEMHEAIAVAVTLFQVSELSLVLARLALDSGAISDDLYSLIIIVGLLTMLLTPLLVRLALRWQPQNQVAPLPNQSQ